MPTAFEGFEQGGSIIPVKDTTARNSITAIEEKIPSGASSSNKLATASDVAAKISSTEKGTNNGVATLGNDGRVPSSQLPSYVDDVLEYASTSAFPAEGDAGKIYVALDTNKTYRWGGSEYVEISESIALGETQGTAYEGSKGKANADNITNIQAVIPSGATSSNKLATASDVTAVSDAVSAIKDGTDIDSFSDVESALGDVDTAINGIKDGTDIDSFSDVESALSNKVDKVSGKGLSTNDYDNTAKGVVDNIQDNVKANTKLIKDTVGWSNKNIITYPYYDKSKTVNGLTFTMLPDGGVKINGTATDNTGYNFTPNGNTGIVLNGKYKMLGNAEFGDSRLKMTVEAPHGVNWDSISADITEKEFTNATVQNIRLWMYAGQVFDNVVVYPMLWDAKILDPTFEINYGTTAFPRSEQAVLGAKNLLPFPYYRGNTYTENGITYTCDEQGRVNINGTLSAQISTYAFISDKGYNLQWLNGKVLSGFSNGSIQTFDIAVALNQSPWTTYARQTDTDTIISGIPNEDIPIAVKIEVRQNMDNVLLSPMISLNGGEFAPYAKTNRELTEDVAKLSGYLEQSVTLSTIGTTAVTFTDASITANSQIQYGCSTWGIIPDDITCSNGSCVVTMPKVASAATVTVRIYVR